MVLLGLISDNLSSIYFKVLFKTTLILFSSFNSEPLVSINLIKLYLLDIYSFVSFVPIFPKLSSAIFS